MRVLDLDLDLFISEPAYWPDGRDRLCSDEYQVWSNEVVTRFLEVQCGLSTSKPIPGVVVTDHHEVFSVWCKLIEEGRLSTPFDVVHVDSHSDLGLGDGGWVYLLGDILHCPVEDRTTPQVGNKFMNEGNYLTFAIACRWIESLTFVHHDRRSDDLMPHHFRDFDTSSQVIELKKYDPASLPPISGDIKKVRILATEPAVPFKKVCWADYATNKPFDFFMLAKSPRYTPVEADALIPLIEKFIQPL